MTYDYGFRIEYQNQGSRLTGGTAMIRFLPAADDEEAEAIGQKIAALIEAETGVKVNSVHASMSSGSKALKLEREQVAALEARPYRQRKKAGGTEFVKI